MGGKSGAVGRGVGGWVMGLKEDQIFSSGGGVGCLHTNTRITD